MIETGIGVAFGVTIVVTVITGVTVGTGVGMVVATGAGEKGSRSPDIDQEFVITATAQTITIASNTVTISPRSKSITGG